MMKITDEQVRHALYTFVTRAVATSFTAEVIDNSKAETDGYVKVSHNELTYNVKLQALTGATNVGLLQVPSVGSHIFCVNEGNSDNRYVAAAFTDIEKVVFKQGENCITVNEESIELRQNNNTISMAQDSIKLEQGNNTVDINKERIEFNGGDLKGLVKLTELENNLDSLKGYLESMNKAIPEAFNAILAGTATNGELGATMYSTQMAGKEIKFENMENKKIKQ